MLGRLAPTAKLRTHSPRGLVPPWRRIRWALLSRSIIRSSLIRPPRCADISYTKAPSWLKATPGDPNDKTSRFWDLARLSFPDARREWLNSGQPIDQTPSPVLNAVEDPDQQMLCMDYLYYVGAITGVRSHRWACGVRPLT